MTQESQESEPNVESIKPEEEEEKEEKALKEEASKVGGKKVDDDERDDVFPKLPKLGAKIWCGLDQVEHFQTCVEQSLFKHVWTVIC